MTFGSVVPTGVAVLKSGMPEGVARSTARHSGRLARTRSDVSRAWTRSTSAAEPSGSVRASDCSAEIVRRSSVSTAVAKARARSSDDCSVCSRCSSSRACSATPDISASGRIATAASSSRRLRKGTGRFGIGDPAATTRGETG